MGIKTAPIPELQDSRQASDQKPLLLSKYQPNSMLHVKETQVSRARYPVIAFPTHITKSSHILKGMELAASRVYNGLPQELLPVSPRTAAGDGPQEYSCDGQSDRRFETGLQDAMSKYDRRWPGRFYSFTEPSCNLFEWLDYPR